MADQLDISQLSTQVEYGKDALGVSQLVVQVEYGKDALGVSQLVVQVEYGTGQLDVSQLCTQVEYYNPAENLTQEILNLGASVEHGYLGLHLIPLTNNSAGAIRIKTASGTYSIAYSL